MAAVPGVRRSELGDALRACRSAFIGVGAMSCMINLLYLTGSIFMLEIYDRVLPSRSVPTLVGLIILAGGLYIAQGVLDLIRGRILGRTGTSLDEALNSRVFETIVRLPLMVGGRNEGLQPLRDLANVRSFLGSLGPESAVLAGGAYLVIHQEATAGIIIAGSILSARALAPVDLAIAHWRGFVAARQSWQRLNRLLESLPAQAVPTLLQSPSSRLSGEGVSIAPPGGHTIIGQEVTS